MIGLALLAKLKLGFGHNGPRTHRPLTRTAPIARARTAALPLQSQHDRSHQHRAGPTLLRAEQQV